ncbi:MAG: matrixin family metalloprotease [Polyangiaceae bacterium]
MGCFGFGGDGGLEGGAGDGGATAGLHPLFWRNTCVSYSFQSSPSKYLSLSDAKRIAAAAFDTWHSAACPGGNPSITAVPFPEVQCDSVPSTEHSNLIIFRDKGWPYDDSANAIGYTTLTVDLSTGEILGADTEINSAQWTIVAQPPAPANAYDFATIMTHEAGHFLGLAHTGDTSAVMYALYHPDTALQSDDIAGICSIYHPDGTHETSDGPVLAESCNPVPLAGFLAGSCGSFDAGTVNVDSIGSGPGASNNGLTSPCPPDPSGCTVAGRPSQSDARWLAGRLLAMAALAGIAVARRNRRRRAGALLALAIAAAASGGLGEKRAEASVSAAAVFDDLVHQSSAVAVVTVLDQTSEWEANRIVTYTGLRVDRLVAGQLPAQIRLRAHGGTVGHIGQIVEGQPTFAVGSTYLVFLRPHVDLATGAASDSFVVVDGAQGQFVVQAVGGKPARLSRAANVGSVIDPSAGPGAARLARDVLEGRAIDDAAAAIAAAFRGPSASH